MACGLLTFEPSAPVPDVELEQAALRFANGDLAGAQQALQSALRAAPSRSDAPLQWAAALLDLGRTTGQRALFDATVSEYGRHFERGVPVWFSVPDALTPKDTEAAPSEAGAVGLWCSPSVLEPDAVAQLSACLLPVDLPCQLDWSQLETISTQAAPDLQALFARWCGEPVVLKFRGAERLEQALRQLTASGDPTLPVACWRLRLDALRLLQQRDEFELAALDFCVTHETAPPLWVAPMLRRPTPCLPAARAPVGGAGDAEYHMSQRCSLSPT
jgi:hypothetical protein